MSEVLSGWIDSTVASRIALTLVHFLWQGMLIAILVWLIGAMLRSKSANARYSVFLGGLLSMAVCAVVTFVVMQAYVQKDSVSPVSESSIVASSTTSDNQHDSTGMLDEVDSVATDLSVVPQSALPVIENDLSASTLETNALVSEESSDIEPSTSLSVWQKATPFVAAAYVFGVVILLGRLMLGLRGGWNLRRHSEPVDNASLLSLLARRAQALGMRVSPALCHCRDIAVPTVVGILRPTILLPMSLIAGLSPDQVEAILTHELAHIRRFDHLVNILQRVIEAILFFHPAVWWVSRRIRIEREHCCDDVVVGLGAEPLRYAASLIEVAELGQKRDAFTNIETIAALHATGDHSQLGRRIRRLVGSPLPERVLLTPRSFVSLVCVVLTACLIPLATLSTVGETTKETVAPPTLRFISHEHVRAAKGDFFVLRATQPYWFPDGQLRDVDSERRLLGWFGPIPNSKSKPGPRERWLHLWFACAESEAPPSGFAELRDPKGQLLARSRSTHSEPAKGELEEQSWLMMQFRLDAATMPKAADVHLTYSQGDWRDVAGIRPGGPRGVKLPDGVSIEKMGVARDREIKGVPPKAFFLSLTSDRPHREIEHEFGCELILKDGGSTSLSASHKSGPGETWKNTFSWEVPRKRIREVRIRVRRTKTQTYRNVALRQTAMSPRETVSAFLKLSKSGAREKARALTSPDSPAVWWPKLKGLREYDRIRPMHLATSDQRAIVLSNTFLDNSGRKQVVYALLRKQKGKWLIYRHEVTTPDDAAPVIEGFTINPDVKFDVMPAELVGQWAVNVCHSYLSLAADGTGTQLLTGPGGPEPGAKPEPFKWSVKGNTLTRRFADRVETLKIQWVEDNSVRLTTSGDFPGRRWSRTPRSRRDNASRRHKDVGSTATFSLTLALSGKGSRPFMNLATGETFAAPEGIPIEPPFDANDLKNALVKDPTRNKPNALQLWAEETGVTLGLVEYDGKPYLQSFGHYGCRIEDEQEATRLWETMTAEKIREEYRLGGFGILHWPAFEAYFTIALDQPELPQTWRLASLGLLRVEQFTGGDRPTVKLKLKVLKRDAPEGQSNNSPPVLETKPEGADSKSAGELGFHPTHDIRTGGSDEGKFTFFDFEAGRMAHPPFALTFGSISPKHNVTTLKITDRLQTWIERNHIDAVIETASDRVGLRALRMKGAMRKGKGGNVPNRPTRFDELTASQVARALSSRAGAARPVWFAFVIEPAPLGRPEIRLIRTDDGSLGVLEVTALVSELGLADARVRWKLVRDTRVKSVDETTRAARQRHFVCLVVGKDKLTFEGQETTWEELPDLLGKVPNRADTVFEFAFPSDDFTDDQKKEIIVRCVRTSQQFGFEYPSDTGVKPLGSKGSPSQDRTRNEDKQKENPTGAADHPTRWGTLAGRIVLDGKPPLRKKIEIPKESRRDNAGRTIPAADPLYHNLDFYDESLVVDKDGGIANVVIYATSPNMPAHPDTAKLSERAATASLLKGRFQHRITPIVVGQKLIVTNVDKTFHTFSMINATNNEWFNVIVRDRFEYSFKKAEPVPVKLSSAIAPWPTAYLLPRENPYVAVSAADGTFKFDKLPVGTWEFRVWHERARNPLHNYRIDIKEGDNSVNALKINPQALARPDAGEQVDDNDDKDDQAAWGKAVNGVQARLRLSKRQWKIGGTPRLLADVRNQGTTTYWIGPAQPVHEIEIDGKWHQWAGRITVLHGGFRPGSTQRDVPFTLVQNWKHKSSRFLAPDRTQPLNLAPGKHTVRVAFLMNPITKGAKNIRAESNPVEIEILQTGTNKDGSPTDASAATRGKRLTETERKLLGSWKSDEAMPITVTFHREGTFIATASAGGYDVFPESGTWKLDGTKLIRTITKSREKNRIRTKLVRLLLKVDGSELRLGELPDGKRFRSYQRVKTDKVDSKEFAADTLATPVPPKPTLATPVSPKFAIYRVVGHRNALPFGGRGIKKRKILFSNEGVGSDRFDSMRPENYPLEGLILSKTPLLTEADIVSYDWSEHEILVKPKVRHRILSKIKPTLWGVPFAVVVKGSPVYLGAFWTGISSYTANMPTISLDPPLLSQPKGETGQFRKYVIPIDGNWVTKPGEIRNEPRSSPRIREALKQSGKLRELRTGAKAARSADVSITGTVLGIDGKPAVGYRVTALPNQWNTAAS